MMGARGAGPPGERCRTCRHKRSTRRYGGAINKCALVVPHDFHPLNHLSTTDIRLKWEACEYWQAPARSPA